MRNKSLITVVLALAMIAIAAIGYGRGFGGFHGGGGFGGGGFGGGGFGGGGFRGGGGFGGGGFGGGGGFDRGGFNGGFHGDERLGGLTGGGFGGDRFGGGQFGGGMSRQMGNYEQPFAGGRLPSGSGGLSSFDRGLDSLRSGSGGGEFGNAGERSGDSGRFAQDRGNISDSQLNSFLGLPTDMGMHSAGSANRSFANTGSTRGITNGDAAAAGERGASGHVYTGPNGTTIAHGSAGERGAVVGPNGAAAGERGVSGTVVKGPDGNTVAHASAGERGVAVGPNGAVGGSRGVSGTAVRGADGNVVARGSAVTRNWSSADMRVQGNYVRNNFNNYGAFNRNWYDHYPNAWGRGFLAGAWAGANWASVNGWFGSDWPPYEYSYGDDITYANNNVYYNGQPIATADEYYQSAANLAQTGEQASIPNQSTSANNQPNASNPQWLSLGVFNALREGEKTSPMMFQLAVNKVGIVRGNYFDTKDDNDQQVDGSVDKKTQRIAWVVEDQKKIIFDTGLYNLTKEETPVLVHMGKDKTEQWLFVRLKQKSDGTAKQ